jgi:hypothetical protein
MTTSLYKSRSITHDHPISFGSTLQVLQTIAVPWQYPLSTPPGTFLHFFLKTLLYNQNLILGNVVIFTTVHDQGLGYSNRFTLCRGCTLYPHHPINPLGYITDRHTQVCGVRIIDQSLPSIHLSTSAYPMESTSPACPGSTSSRA